MRNVVTHWKFQRYTAIAIIPLSVWLVYSILCMKDYSFQQTYSWFSSPFNAFFVILFFINSFLHLKLGLQIVVEDYIHSVKYRNLTILLINISCYIFASVAILAILSMLF